MLRKSTAFIGHVEAPNVKKSISMATRFAIAETLEIPVYKFVKCFACLIGCYPISTLLDAASQ